MAFEKWPFPLFLSFKSHKISLMAHNNLEQWEKGSVKKWGSDVISWCYTKPSRTKYQFGIHAYFFKWNYTYNAHKYIHKIMLLPNKIAIPGVENTATLLSKWDEEHFFPIFSEFFPSSGWVQFLL